ncbi:EexN family lipoprotein [Methylocystis parvus]|uniref:EexN family lipoprotein n=1 Tax=Methylocystis parvus TaxID=134 RepID=A0A6B8ME84_9HYPH|nr:EexN family lipoprotein [Methylocystis parvus]QGN00043.1 EexN family lipoprotein [Methylocystis parvus]WBK02458.1 EexN family lipoprotein [Methylocystis parvus OBBP]
MKTLASTLLIATCLSGCDREPRSSEPAPKATPVVHDVSWYLENEAEHATTKRRCKANPGTLRDTAECINADQAQKQIFIWGREEALRRSREGR